MSRSLAGDLDGTPVETVDDCLLCGDSAVAWDPRWDGLLALVPPYRTRRCRRCGLRWLSPRPGPEACQIIYGDDHYFHSGVVAAYSQYAEERASHFRRRAEGLARDGIRTLLDYGAATGEFVAAARKAGIDAAGVEFSADARRDAIARHGVHLLSPEAMEQVDCRFDAIHMNHVLEHMPDPLSHLRWCHGRLREGGLLVSEVPHQFDNLTDRLRRLRGIGGRQQGFDAFSVHHMYFFTPSTYRKIVEAAGFRVESLFTLLSDNPYIRSRARRLLERGLRVVAARFRTGDAIEVRARKAARGA